MKKPSWVTLLDLASFGGISLFAAGITTYATIVGFEGPNALQGEILSWVVVATFFAIWGRYSWLKKKSFDEFTWYPTYGFMVHGNGYTLPTAKDFDFSVERTVRAWKLFHPAAEQVVKSEVNWVFFVKGLNENDKNPTHTKVNGYTFAQTHNMTVNFNNASDPFDQTAFEHELGHVIRGYSTGNWDMAEHHAFMAANGLR
jgi:hypothetical protein